MPRSHAASLTHREGTGGCSPGGDGRGGPGPCRGCRSNSSPLLLLLTALGRSRAVLSSGVAPNSPMRSPCRFGVPAWPCAILAGPLGHGIPPLCTGFLVERDLPNILHRRLGLCLSSRCVGAAVRIGAASWGDAGKAARRSVRSAGRARAGRVPNAGKEMGWVETH